VEGRGYFWNHEKQKKGKVWRSLGCGTSGSGTVTWKGKGDIPVTALPQVRAKVQPGFLGGAYRWRH
jgi:hypothetical protein